ncbi:hypothetical protein BL241_00475 [Ralstonia solanacearum]|nr:hypothetical protein BL241_00475 [Ralstonia solanacearum]
MHGDDIKIVSGCLTNLFFSFSREDCTQEESGLIVLDVDLYIFRFCHLRQDKFHMHIGGYGMEVLYIQNFDGITSLEIDNLV